MRMKKKNGEKGLFRAWGERRREREARSDLNGRPPLGS